MVSNTRNQFIEAERIFKALANRRRLAILHFLHKRAASVGDIAEHMRLSYPATSRHLHALSAVDLIESRQTNTSIVYSVPKDKHLALEVALKLF